MTNVVMTGRRMNGSAIFIADFLVSLSRGFDLNFHAGNQPKLAVRHHRLSRFNSLRDYGFRAKRSRHFHRARFSSLIRIDYEHEIAGLSGLHRLWPGQFSTVSLRLSEDENATVVPAQAVQTGQAGDFVFVINSDQRAESRPVKVARTLGAESVIAKGVEPGETVVTDGQLRLIPGIKVQIKTAPQGN